MNALDRKVGDMLAAILDRRDPAIRWHARPVEECERADPRDEHGHEREAS